MFGFSALVPGLNVLLLPLGRNLPETLQDGEEFPVMGLGRRVESQPEEEEIEMQQGLSPPMICSFNEK